MKMNKDNISEGVVVIGGHVQGLGIARMIGNNGIPVIVMDYTKYNIARYSKYVRKYIDLTSSPEEEEKSLVNELITLAKTHNLSRWLLFPTDDNTVATLSKFKNQLSEIYLIWTPEWDVVKLFYDKIQTYKLADNSGIAIPKSLFPRDLDDVKHYGKTIQYPVIIKPAVMQNFYNKTNLKAIVVNSLDELVEKYNYVSGIIDPSEIIIQEIIPGSPKNLYSCGVFFKDGKIVTSVIGRRARQIPMDFGKASTFVELVDIPELYSISQSLLANANYYGMAEVEFKYDERDGMYKLLEVNPRGWKWHVISLLENKNIPLMIYNDMHNQSIDIQFTINGNNNHLVWIDEFTDLFISLKEIIGHRMSLGEYYSSISGMRIFGAISLHDPLPFIMETLFIPILMRR